MILCDVEFNCPFKLNTVTATPNFWFFEFQCTPVKWNMSPFFRQLTDWPFANPPAMIMCYHKTTNEVNQHHALLFQKEYWDGVKSILVFWLIDSIFLSTLAKKKERINGLYLWNEEGKFNLKIAYVFRNFHIIILFIYVRFFSINIFSYKENPSCRSTLTIARRRNTILNKEVRFIWFCKYICLNYYIELINQKNGGPQ